MFDPALPQAPRFERPPYRRVICLRMQSIGLSLHNLVTDYALILAHGPLALGTYSFAIFHLLPGAGKPFFANWRGSPVSGKPRLTNSSSMIFHLPISFSLCTGVLLLACTLTFGMLSPLRNRDDSASFLAFSFCL